jgi:uncharacterized protein YecT (DUF1311 family)
MRKCPFCMEDIQDKAIKCKHCGANIGAAVAAAKEEAVAKSMTKLVGVVWGVIGAALFGFVAYRGLQAGDLRSAVICGGFALAFLIVAPVAWYVGSLAVAERGPTLIIASSQSELMKQQLIFEYGAPLFAVAAVFVLMGYGITKLVPVDQILDGGSGNSGASVAASAPSLAASTPGVSAVGSDPSAQGETQVAGVQTSASDATTSTAITSRTASSSAETQGQQQPADTPKVGNALTAQSDQSASAVQPLPSAGTTPDTNVAARVDASSAGSTSAAVPTSVPSGVRASFDCSQASSRTERLICSTPETANADVRLAAAYGVARSKSSDPSALKADQRNWLTTERNACTDAACLTKVMEARIQKLVAM